MRAALELLLDEARAAAAINHPSVAAIYDAGEAEGVAFIAMEYVDGVTLRSRMARVERDARRSHGSPSTQNATRLSIREVLGFAQQIAEGLAKAHERGIVHRDLKPDNVMIDRDDRIKILDFGLARSAWEEGAPRARAAVIAGTPMYMSPEQARGEPVDARSDVFSFGVLLYEMLAGKGPFSVRGLIPAYWRFEPDAPLASLRDDVPPALLTILERCLQPRPAQRYAGGRPLARALSALAGASKPKWIAIAVRGHSRWRGVALGIGASLAAVIVCTQGELALSSESAPGSGVRSGRRGAGRPTLAPRLLPQNPRRIRS